MNKQRGFLLIELLMAVSLFAVAVVAISAFAVYYFQNYAFTFTETQSTGLAQQGLTTMIREIRELRYGEDGSWPLIQANDNAISFYSDVTGDGRTDKVRYFLDGTTLQKGVIQPASGAVLYPGANEVISTIATSVAMGAKPIFTYYNGNWPVDTTNNPIPQADRVTKTRFIDVDIIVNIATGSAAQPFELTSGVQIRNLKDNL